MTKTIDRILRMAEVESYTGLKRSRIYELEARGAFPKRIAISSRAVGWRQSAISAWVSDRPEKSKTLFRGSFSANWGDQIIERCAKVCDDFATAHPPKPLKVVLTAQTLANSIRAFKSK